MSVDYADRLKQMDDTWAETKAASAPGELPPDGTYQAIVDRFDFFESKAGQLFLKTEMVVTNGDHEGHPIETIHNLEDPDRLGWAKKHLRTLGLELEALSELEGQLPNVLDTPVEIAVKTSTTLDNEGNPYRNVYVNKRLGDPIERSDVTTREAVAAVAASQNGSDTDDIPF
jgi:hypothetical protein